MVIIIRQFFISPVFICILKPNAVARTAMTTINLDIIFSIVGKVMLYLILLIGSKSVDKATLIPSCIIAEDFFGTSLLLKTYPSLSESEKIV